MVSGFLADTSVLHRVGRSPEIARRIAALRNVDQLWTCDIVSLELGYSARSQVEWLGIQSVQSGLQQAPITGEVMARALQAQGAMAAIGKHRVKISDLVIAAAAAEVGVTVLHYDVDFERISSTTGQVTEWAVQRGSID